MRLFKELSEEGLAALDDAGREAYEELKAEAETRVLFVLGGERKKSKLKEGKKKGSKKKKKKKKKKKIPAFMRNNASKLEASKEKKASRKKKLSKAAEEKKKADAKIEIHPGSPSQAPRAGRDRDRGPHSSPNCLSDVPEPSDCSD